MAKVTGSLVEVARRCSVSQSTVSRVLNNAKQGRFSVSAEVRERILRVAEEMNYRPSVAARNLAADKTMLVSVLGVSGLGSDRVGPDETAIGALSGALDRAGYEICVQFYGHRHARFDPPPLRVDGIVAVSSSNENDLVGLERGTVPYVCLNALAGPHGSSVIPDDARGTRLALRHLLDLGHRKIAYLDHPSISATHASVFERRETFRSCSTEMGFEIAAVKVPMLPPNTPWDSYYEPFLREGVMKQGATAVLAYSHHGALALMRLAHDLGLSVPNDFSLACFNNEPAVQLSIPSITAIDVPALRMGQVAAELLIRQMNSTDLIEPVTVKLEETLVVRESTAPPGGRRLGNGIV
jgi:DNA-binding LacI/PurR family transcriptional regulator